MTIGNILSLANEAFALEQLTKDYITAKNSTIASKNGKITGINGTYVGLVGTHTGEIGTITGQIGSAWNNKSLQAELRLKQNQVRTNHKAIQASARKRADAEIAEIRSSLTATLSNLESEYRQNQANIDKIAYSFVILQIGEIYYPILRFSSVQVTNKVPKVQYNGHDYTSEIEGVDLECALKYCPDQSKWIVINNSNRFFGNGVTIIGDFNVGEFSGSSTTTYGNGTRVINFF
jgi:hypothetical protein